ncbi:pullulanase-type alpha-1,6-glucosidase [Sphingomicrobium marinum]|uniref:pullulanase-type alpha-1,6-glucosidase n=1 Tax=Sphingomicrobium marinum TaxID=1227950 RepID=UPI002240412E|nr:pullulanase-type alpha-1,6-glucosidase [Sphingomicrobium marinum]
MNAARQLISGIIAATILSLTGACAPTEPPPASTAAAPTKVAHARAHWLTPHLIAWEGEGMPNLRAGASTFPLAAAGSVAGELALNFPHLAGMPLWRVEAPPENVRAFLKQPLTLMGEEATGIQIGPVLDALYANDLPLGARRSDTGWDISVWAPTARSLTLLLFDSSMGGNATRLPMSENAQTGVWSISGPADWNRKYYVYEVEVYVPSTGQVERNIVTDPYSLNLAPDSKRTQIIDLDDADLKPAGWDAFARDLPQHPEDRSIYELHVRDFSSAVPGLNPAKAGKYLAFADPDLPGSRHLTALAQAGLTDVHLLPTNDCASIPEVGAVEPDQDALAAMAPDSEQQQALVKEASAGDGFNWCYDPLHYLAPEGSYASTPDGTARIIEFRQMVMGLSDMGLGTVLDVVFNHTPAHGQGDKSVLDKIVPGYYQRLDADGNVANSTCCSNTASERRMMERLLVEGLMVWARDYKVSGFRFDLMGHHSKDNILKGREALRTLTLEQHGVDGRDLLIYGEGWNFGEVADNARFIQATQREMAGTGIGTFNDRIRDAIRGGAYNSKAEEAVRRQGFASGLFTAPNRMTSSDDAARAEALRLADHVRAGLAGSLADFAFENADGVVRRLGDMDYNGQPLGYVSDPQETINYAAAHDNPTLFDSNVWKLPLDTSKDDRVRWQNLANSLVVLAQGIPFIHAGQDLLRTKSLDHNSYDSGDWFNRIDFSGQHHWWGRGLAHRADNEVDWPIARTLLSDDRMAMEPQHIARAAAHMREMLKIRTQTRNWFTISDAESINTLLRFGNTGPDQVPGLIVMLLGAEGDERVVVVFNATRAAQQVDYTSSQAFALHEIQQNSDDPIVRTAQPNAAGFKVPALTTAVFVKAD